MDLRTAVRHGPADGDSALRKLTVLPKKPLSRHPHESGNPVSSLFLFSPWK
jgi:hypothetical protein